jgi:hypothetical protein
MIAQLLTYCTNIFGLDFQTDFGNWLFFLLWGIRRHYTGSCFGIIFLYHWRMVGIETEVFVRHEGAFLLVIETGKFLSTDR